MSNIFADYSFGGWLKRFRIDRKITMREYCRNIKMDVSNYCAIEQSRLAPPRSFKNLLKITKPLKLSKVEMDFLKTAAISFHVGKVHKEWEK